MHAVMVWVNFGQTSLVSAGLQNASRKDIMAVETQFSALCFLLNGQQQRDAL